MKFLSMSTVLTFALLVAACSSGSKNYSANNADDSNNPKDNTQQNSTPKVSLSSDNMSAALGSPIILDASASTDDDGDVLTYSWSGPGIIEKPNANKTRVSDLGIGVHQFTIEVSDGERTSNKTLTVEITGPQIMEIIGLNTGSVAEPVKVYFDLDTGTEVALTEETEAANEEWDIAFLRTKVYLNRYASTPVTVAFANNTDNFYDENNQPVVDRFVNATAETEFDAFAGFNGELTESTEFYGDEEEPGVYGFYNYDVMTHVVSAADDAYFIVSSDNAYAKFRATDISTSGRSMASLTLAVSYQGNGNASFGDETELLLDAADCDGDVYADLATKTVVTENDDWDIKIPCSDGAAEFAIGLAADAQVMRGEAAAIDGVDPASTSYYPWRSNVNELRAIAEHGAPQSTYGWAEYGVNGGHFIWPNFAIYVVNTAEASYTFQITGYYDPETLASGTYSIRYQKIISE